MKLWLLLPRDPDSGLWDPWYDKAFGFVIQAETEQDARRLAHENAGDENRGAFLDLKLGPPDSAWLDSEFSSCAQLSADGEPMIIMRDYRSA